MFNIFQFNNRSYSIAPLSHHVLFQGVWCQSPCNLNNQVFDSVLAKMIDNFFKKSPDTTNFCYTMHIRAHACLLSLKTAKLPSWKTKRTRISQFSAYVRTTFSGHTKFRHCSPYITLNICHFLWLVNQNRYANEVLNMQIQWRQNLWVILVPTTTHIPSFITSAHTKLRIIVLFVISQSEQQNRFTSEVLNMHIWWQQTTWVVLVPTTIHILSFTKISQGVLIREVKVNLFGWRATNMYTSIHTTL